MQRNLIYDDIYEALVARIRPDDADSERFVDEIALVASEVAKNHVQELLEANGHLKETISRLSKES
jgi:hypothetical protein